MTNKMNHAIAVFYLNTQTLTKLSATNLNKDTYNLNKSNWRITFTSNSAELIDFVKNKAETQPVEDLSGSFIISDGHTDLDIENAILQSKNFMDKIKSIRKKLIKIL